MGRGTTEGGLRAKLDSMEHLLWVPFVIDIVLDLIEYGFMVGVVYVPTLKTAHQLEEFMEGKKSEGAHMFKLIGILCLAVHTVALVILLALDALSIFEHLTKREWHFTFMRIGQEPFIQFQILLFLMLLAYLDYIDNVSDSAVIVGYVLIVLIFLWNMFEVCLYLWAWQEGKGRGEKAGEEAAVAAPAASPAKEASPTKEASPAEEVAPAAEAEDYYKEHQA